MTEPLECLSVTDAASLFDVCTRLAAAPGWVVMALDYELGKALEPALAGESSQQPFARFWRFAECRQLSTAALDAWLQEQLAALPEGTAIAGIGDLQASLAADEYLAKVERIRHYIAAGDCYQVNLTFALDFCHFGHPLALYAALRERQPVRYGGLVVNETGAIVSLSPELFLERRGSRLITRPMKGTAARASDPELLQHSEKNRAENLMIVDLLRNDLGRVAETGSVKVESLFVIEEYPSVWQMVSQVAAEAPAASLFETLRALFPCGSITGAPKIRAMQIAAELETVPRRLYTGALGWLAPQGDFRLNVAIRTLELAADGRGRMGIGSGIVADSVAHEEWQECLLKASFLSDYDPGFALIETMRREHGQYPQLSAHLARLAASARWLGFVCDLAAVRGALAAVAGAGVQRVRLSLGKDGQVKIKTTTLTDEVSGPRIACLAAEQINAAHPLQRHKTTARAHYDRALASIAGTPEIFDLVFLNQRGEVAEGARSTVFVARDGVLLTPPLASGALPGILRGELLASGRAREAVLWPADLAAGFYFGNALRGLVNVRLRT